MLKKMEENKLVYFLITTLVVFICAIIIWPILDFLLYTYITKSEFVYSIHNHILQPLIFSVIYATISTLFFKKQK